MTAGPVNRALLESFFQQPGQIYDDTKTESSFDVIADQIDENWSAQSLHRTATVLDHPDGSVTNEKIANGTLTADKFFPGVFTNETQNGLAIIELKADIAKSTACCFGDSFTRTVSDVNAPADRDQFETYLWFNLVCDSLKTLYNKNNGVSGSRCEQVFRTLHSTIRNDVHYQKNILSIGYNDLTDFKGVTNANEDIANKIQTMCVYLKTRNKKSEFNPNTWAWVNSDELGYALNPTSGLLGVWRGDDNSPIGFTFTGRYLVILTVDNVMSGTYLVKSDGVTIFNADIKRNKRSTGVASYCLKVDCGSEGTHTIEFSSPNGKAYIGGYGEYDSSIEVYVNNITKRTDTTYDADTAAINTFITTRISELGDANVKAVSMSNFVPSIYVGTDSLHPNILGHMKIAENILSTINT